MSAMTNYLEYKLLDHVLMTASFTMPAANYLSLHTTDPTDTGSLSGEITTVASGYARQTLASSMGAADHTAGVAVNTATITFGPATSDWGAVAYIAISDAVTGATMLLHGALDESQTTPVGESVQLTPGQFSVTFA
jgi:hypothetical protein